MLKLVAKSSNKKLGDIASTYRAGQGNVWSTCPNSCPLKPDHGQGSNEVDEEYLEALLDAVPRDGMSWTYTHFPRREEFLGVWGKPQTTINISMDTIDEALESSLAGYPTVVVRGSDEIEKVEVINGTRFVRCPAEYIEHVTCKNCGGKPGPLCARRDRDFVVKFTAHGQSKGRINARQEGSEEKGGCYGSGGPVHLQWKKTSSGDATELTDGEKLIEWVDTLKPGTYLRSHVLGDLGRVH